MKAAPFIYFEIFNEESTINDWIFVNLDCTDFVNLFKIKNSSSNIICKNKYTFNILSKINKNLFYTGFTSVDKFLYIKRYLSSTKIFCYYQKNEWRNKLLMEFL